MIYRRLSLLLFLAAAIVGWVSWMWIDEHRKETPLAPEQHYAAGLDAIAHRDFDSARYAVDALDSWPEFQDHARILRAAIQLKQGRPRETVQLLKDRPADPQLRNQASVFLAEAFFLLRDLHNALHAAQYVVNADRDNVEGHWWSAAVFYDLGLNDAAVKELNVVASLNKADYRPHYLIGLIQLETELFSEAAASFRAALARKPPEKEGTDAILNLAKTLLKLRRYDEAAAMLAGSSQGNAELLALESQARWAQGKQADAKRLIAQAERLGSENRLVLLQKARILIHEGELPTAAACLEKCLSQDPHDMESRYQLALCYRKMQMPQRYEVEIARYEESKRIRRELSDLTTKSMEEPANAPIRDRIAVLYDKLGRPRVAASYRQAAEACRRLKRK